MAVNDEESEERLVESNSSVTRTTTISELPGKSYGITLEVPIFLTTMGLALIGIVFSFITNSKTYIVFITTFAT